MAKKIIEGLWDCPYCGQRGISGLTKSCPNCAHPQDAGTKFYLGEKKEAMDAEKAENYGKGADWTCAFCGSLNRYNSTNCNNCGAQREDSSGDYFENRRREQAAQAPPPQPQPPKKKKKTGLIILGLVILAIIIGFIASRPRDKATTVSDKTWQRSIAVEAYTTVEESGWSVPNGGRLLDSSRAIHHYDQVLDGYVEEEYDVPYEVLDGYDEITDYEDNGDGTFTEVVTEVPRYRTEYRTETRTVPVYRQEPVYQTYYKYEIDKWIPARTESAGGSCYEPRTSELRGLSVEAEPYWPDTRLGGSERESGREEHYILYFTDAKGNSYSAEVSEAIWNKYSRDQGVELETVGRRVVSIDGVRIGQTS